MNNNITIWLDETAAKYPDKVGYADEHRSLTFAEARLGGLSLAAELVRRDLFKQPVAIYMDKSVEVLTAMFGTAYSGNFYTPIDVNMPAARVGKIFDILKPAVIVTKQALAKQLDEVVGEGIPRIAVEDLPADPGSCEQVYARRERCCDTDLLYVLFTSGSTGTPKGVTICHQSVMDYIDCVTDTFGFSEADVLGNQAPFYFDNSVLDIYTAMRTGATLQIIPEKLFAWPLPLLDYVEQRRINAVFWVPTVMILLSKLRAFGKKDMAGQLTKILFAGEVMPNKHLNYWRKHIPHALYANLYGPTEITVDCTAYIVDREFADEEPLPMGTPMRNSDVLVLGEGDRLITDAAGGIGELCVRGTSLSKGYYNNPEKTREAFVQNPLQGNYPEVIYRTGDMVSYNDRGELVYMSRKDFQIKHFGYRIELGEIETAVSSIPEVSLNCCLYDAKRDKLVLFVEGQLDFAYIKGCLEAHLPDYMMPNRLICLDSMPINANGKIDRVKLKEMI